jgi:alpha-L-fucosidase
MPHLEEKDFMSEYDISQMVDQPPAGYARVEAFFTAKNDVVYAILPHWPDGDFILNDISTSPNTKLTLLETGDPIEFHTEGKQVTMKLPPELRLRLPGRVAYVLKITGVTRS